MYRLLAKPIAAPSPTGYETKEANLATTTQYSREAMPGIASRATNISSNLGSWAVHSGEGASADATSLPASFLLSYHPLPPFPPPTGKEGVREGGRDYGARDKREGGGDEGLDKKRQRLR